MINAQSVTLYLTVTLLKTLETRSDPKISSTNEMVIFICTTNFTMNTLMSNLLVTISLTRIISRFFR